MWRHWGDVLAIATLMIIVINVTWAASVDIQADNQMPFSNPDIKDSAKPAPDADGREIRCYCNQPECVPQGYMCLGSRGCFTKLPSHNASSLVRPELSVHNGCLVEREQCPPGFLCCEQDLCNHVDSPAVISRLNKTLQILFVGTRQDLINDENPMQNRQRATIQILKSEENFWFKTATITVAICGILVLLILTTLAIRLLQPVFPMQAKGTHTISENTPPLLELRKAPYV